jgi:hypothetical protein
LAGAPGWFAGVAQQRKKQKTRPAAKRPKDSDDKSSGGESEYKCAQLALCRDESDDEFVTAVTAAIGTTSPGSPEPRPSGGVERVDLYSQEDTNRVFDYTPERVPGAHYRPEVTSVTRTDAIRRTSADVDGATTTRRNSAGGGYSSPIPGAGGDYSPTADVSTEDVILPVEYHSELTLDQQDERGPPYPANYGMGVYVHVGTRSVPVFSSKHFHKFHRAVIRIWSASVRSQPAVLSVHYNKYSEELQELHKNYLPFSSNDEADRAIRKMTIQLINALEEAGLADAPAPVCSRLFMTRKYIKFAKMKEHELDDVAEIHPSDFYDYFGDQYFPSMYESLGVYGVSQHIWEDPNYRIPDDPDEIYCRLMVDWYFESLGVELTIEDHPKIKSKADHYIDKITGLFLPVDRMEARLFGLRALMAPMVHPDETKSSRKQLLQHCSIKIDGVVFLTRLTPQCAVLQEVPGPVTRRHTRAANRTKYIIPWATSLSDAEGTPSRSGPIESGGE